MNNETLTSGIKHWSLSGHLSVLPLAAARLYRVANKVASKPMQIEKYYE